MTFIDDFRSAIDRYDQDYVEVGFTAFQRLGGSILNEDEWFRFQVQLRNNGHLDMDRVVVRVMATEFARVSTSYGTHGSHVDIPFGSVRAHGSAQSPLWVYGYATKHTDGGSDEIVKARVTTWDANLDHLLSDHSGWGADSALKMEVEPRIVT